jgi:hypothetical protein
LVVFGGKVLSVTRVEDATRVEVLQLPLTQDLSPAMEGTRQKVGSWPSIPNKQTSIPPSSNQAPQSPLLEKSSSQRIDMWAIASMNFQHS